MAVKIINTSDKSTFFKKGDILVSVDGKAINDQLDIIFLTSTEKRSLVFEIDRNGKKISRKISLKEFKEAELQYEKMRFKRCRSKCIFCFVDQMPPGLRRSLYIKDDDYRLSFLFGNYITLNDLKDEELERIIEYNLSPLFISVHALDRTVRETLFGRPIGRDIIDILEMLSSGGITFHTQIVLIPGFNDGDILDETVDGLFSLYPSCLSVAVVPVGLTAHREGLTKLRTVTPMEAKKIVRWARSKASYFRGKTSGESGFVYISDELYLIADEEIPPDNEYDGYPQLANGVGMCRNFIENFIDELEKLGKEKLNCNFGVVTGKLGGLFFKHYIEPLMQKKLNFIPHWIITENRLFGTSVTVSGLLSGNDILRAIEENRGLSMYVIPPNTLNHEGKFLDDMTPKELERRTNVKILVPENTFMSNEILEVCQE